MRYIYPNYDWVDSLYTDISSEFLNVFECGQSLKFDIKLRLLHNNDIRRVELYWMEDGDEFKQDMSKCVNQRFDYWSAACTANKLGGVQLFTYRFIIHTDTEYFFWDASGFYRYSVTHNTNFKYYYLPERAVWIDSAVIYHIFIDRFNASDKATHANAQWGTLPSGDIYEFFGGDIAGIQQRLDYIRELGANTICLTPIFESPSNHKYDVQDYDNVAKSLGGNEAFEKFMTQCHKMGIRVILDGVFNHVGDRHKWFNKYSHYPVEGAWQIQNSEYANYFYFSKYPEEYAMFWSEKHLPKLNYRSQNLRERIYRNRNSVMKSWLDEQYSCSGWRLDACCMLGKYKKEQRNDEVLTEMYSAIKRDYPEAYIFGEHPFDPQELQPFRHVDGITNYAGFYNPLIYWLEDSEFDVVDFKDGLMDFNLAFGDQFVRQCKTFIGNHDKQRLFTKLQGDVARYKLALAFMFTYPGTPALYYGEEIGLSDESIPDDSRLCMPWDKFSPAHDDIFNFTKQLISVRQKYSAFRNGAFTPLHAENEVFVFARHDSESVHLITLNKQLNDVTIKLSLDKLGELSGRHFVGSLETAHEVTVRRDNVLELAVSSEHSISMVTSVKNASEF